MNDHRKQNKTILRSTPGVCAEYVELYCGNEMVELSCTVEMKWLIYRVSQNMHVGGVIQASTSRREVFTPGCKLLQDKLCLSPATDK